MAKEKEKHVPFKLHVPADRFREYQILNYTKLYTDDPKEKLVLAYIRAHSEMNLDELRYLIFKDTGLDRKAAVLRKMGYLCGIYDNEDVNPPADQ